MSEGLEVDLAQARAALVAVGERSMALFAAVPDAARPVRRSEWNIGEVGAHLATGLRGYTQAATDDDGLASWGIPTSGTFSERLATVTAGTLVVEPERDPVVLADLIGEGVEGFLAATADRPGEARVPTPFYGADVSLSLATATAMLVGEQLIHGYDVARSLGREWPITASDARLMLRALTSMMRLAVNPATAAGLHAAYELSIRGGGPRMVVRFDGGRVVVEPSPPSVQVDCHISADPVALLLVSYGRIGQWGQIGRGRLWAWGRKPWLGFRFKSLFFNP